MFDSLFLISIAEPLAEFGKSHTAIGKLVEVYYLDVGEPYFLVSFSQSLNTLSCIFLVCSLSFLFDRRVNSAVNTTVKPKIKIIKINIFISLQRAVCARCSQA